MPDAQISAGMTIDQVEQCMPGWRRSMPSAILSMDKTHLFTTFDLLPPAGSSEPPLRMTFDNGRLLFWGTPRPSDGTDSVSNTA